MINRLVVPTVILASLTLVACTQTPNAANNLAFSNNGKFVKVVDEDQVYQHKLAYDIQAVGISPKGQVNVWAEKLVNELVLQNDALRPDEPLLISTPVMARNLNTSNELGIQLQQGLLAAFHAHEFNLVDLNVAIVLVAASRTAAKASGRRSSSDSPLAKRSLRTWVSFFSSSSDSC